MPIRYLVKQFFLPPGLFLLMLLAAWWLRWRYPRLARTGFFGGLLGLWLMSLPIVVEWGGRTLENEPPLPQSAWTQLQREAQAIVVLGAGRERGDPAWEGDQPGHLASERLRYAARLAKASGLPLLLTGGLHYGQPPSEAALMAESLARDYGITVRWREERSRTTWENALFSAPLLRDGGVQRVVLVTQAAHMPRARWCFERQGLQVLAAPVGFLGVDNARPFGGWLPEGKAFWQNVQLLNEALGRLLYPLLY